MDSLIKINNQTAGRDKLARLFQYLSRVLWHRLQKKNIESANGFKNLEFQLSTFRKLLRFGRCFDILHATLPLLNHPEPNVRHTVILSKIAYSLFLLADHFLWLGRADICNINTARWSRISNKYWLVSITMNLVRDFYEITCLIKDHKQAIIPKHCVHSFKDLSQVLLKTILVLQSHPNILLDTVKNGCDIFIPLTALGYVNLSPGTVGWLGVVSSLAGLLVLIDPKLKVLPA